MQNDRYCTRRSSNLLFHDSRLPLSLGTRISAPVCLANVAPRPSPQRHSSPPSESPLRSTVPLEVMDSTSVGRVAARQSTFHNDTFEESPEISLDPYEQDRDHHFHFLQCQEDVITDSVGPIGEERALSDSHLLCEAENLGDDEGRRRPPHSSFLLSDQYTSVDTEFSRITCHTDPRPHDNNDVSQGGRSGGRAARSLCDFLRTEIEGGHHADREVPSVGEGRGLRLSGHGVRRPSSGSFFLSGADEDADAWMMCQSETKSNRTTTIAVTTPAYSSIFTSPGASEGLMCHNFNCHYRSNTNHGQLHHKCECLQRPRFPSGLAPASSPINATPMSYCGFLPNRGPAASVPPHRDRCIDQSDIDCNIPCGSASARDKHDLHAPSRSVPDSFVPPLQSEQGSRGGTAAPNSVGCSSPLPAILFALVDNKAGDIGIAMCHLETATIEILQFGDTVLYSKTMSYLFASHFKYCEGAGKQRGRRGVSDADCSAPGAVTWGDTPSRRADCEMENRRDYVNSRSRHLSRAALPSTPFRHRTENETERRAQLSGPAPPGPTARSATLSSAPASASYCEFLVPHTIVNGKLVQTLLRYFNGSESCAQLSNTGSNVAAATGRTQLDSCCRMTTEAHGKEKGKRNPHLYHMYNADKKKKSAFHLGTRSNDGFYDCSCNDDPSICEPLVPSPSVGHSLIPFPAETGTAMQSPTSSVNTVMSAKDDFTTTSGCAFSVDVGDENGDTQGDAFAFDFQTFFVSPSTPRRAIRQQRRQAQCALENCPATPASVSAWLRGDDETSGTTDWVSSTTPSFLGGRYGSCFGEGERFLNKRHGPSAVTWMPSTGGGRENGDRHDFSTPQRQVLPGVHSHDHCELATPHVLGSERNDCKIGGVNNCSLNRCRENVGRTPQRGARSTAADPCVEENGAKLTSQEHASLFPVCFTAVHRRFFNEAKGAKRLLELMSASISLESDLASDKARLPSHRGTAMDGEFSSPADAGKEAEHDDNGDCVHSGDMESRIGSCTSTMLEIVDPSHYLCTAAANALLYVLDTAYGDARFLHTARDKGRRVGISQRQDGYGCGAALFPNSVRVRYVTLASYMEMNRQTAQAMHIIHNNRLESACRTSSGAAKELVRVGTSGAARVDGAAVLRSPSQFAPTQCLVEAVDFTLSPVGRRMLRGAVVQPLSEMAAIAARYDCVDFLLRHDSSAQGTNPQSESHSMPTAGLQFSERKVTATALLLTLRNALHPFAVEDDFEKVLAVFSTDIRVRDVKHTQSDLLACVSLWVLLRAAIDVRNVLMRVVGVEMIEEYPSETRPRTESVSQRGEGEQRVAAPASEQRGTYKTGECVAAGCRTEFVSLKSAALPGSEKSLAAVSDESARVEEELLSPSEWPISSCTPQSRFAPTQWRAHGPLGSVVSRDRVSEPIAVTAVNESNERRGSMEPTPSVATHRREAAEPSLRARCYCHCATPPRLLKRIYDTLADCKLEEMCEALGMYLDDDVIRMTRQSAQATSCASEVPNGCGLLGRQSRHSRSASSALQQVQLCFLVKAQVNESLDSGRNHYSAVIESILSHCSDIRKRYRIPSLRIVFDNYRQYHLCYDAQHEAQAAAAVVCVRDRLTNRTCNEPLLILAYSGGSHFALHVQYLQEEEQRRRNSQIPAVDDNQNEGGNGSCDAYNTTGWEELDSDDEEEMKCTRGCRSEDSSGRCRGTGSRIATTKPLPHVVRGKKVHCTTRQLLLLNLQVTDLLTALVYYQHDCITPLLTHIRERIGRIQSCCEAIGLLDMLCAFATYSVLHQCVRPELAAESTDHMSDRHPSHFRSGAPTASYTCCRRCCRCSGAGALHSVSKVPTAGDRSSISLLSKRSDESTQVPTCFLNARQPTSGKNTRYQNGAWPSRFPMGATHTELPLFAATFTHMFEGTPNTITWCEPVRSAVVGSDGSSAAVDLHTHRLLLITGPNASGKSTILRQVGQLVCLAQAGCFVPAEWSAAQSPSVTTQFTPCDALHALSLCDTAETAGVSSFQLEMQHLRYILGSATERSVVLLDELGRRTTTHEGSALAWATAEYLANYVRCRSVFVTHYPTLAQLEACTRTRDEGSEGNSARHSCAQDQRGASTSSIANYHLAVAPTPTTGWDQGARELTSREGRIIEQRRRDSSYAIEHNVEAPMRKRGRERQGDGCVNLSGTIDGAEGHGNVDGVAGDGVDGVAVGEGFIPIKQPTLASPHPSSSYRRTIFARTSSATPTLQFSYMLRRGPCNADHYGIRLARALGFYPPALQRAEEIIRSMERNDREAPMPSAESRMADVSSASFAPLAVREIVPGKLYIGPASLLSTFLDSLRSESLQKVLHSATRSKCAAAAGGGRVWKLLSVECRYTGGDTDDGRSSVRHDLRRDATYVKSVQTDANSRTVRDPNAIDALLSMEEEDEDKRGVSLSTVLCTFPWSVATAAATVEEVVEAIRVVFAGTQDSNGCAREAIQSNGGLLSSSLSFNPQEGAVTHASSVTPVTTSMSSVSASTENGEPQCTWDTHPLLNEAMREKLDKVHCALNPPCGIDELSPSIVYVHCANGKQLSCAFVILYMMIYQLRSLKDAFNATLGSLMNPLLFLDLVDVSMNAATLWQTSSSRGTMRWQHDDGICLRTLMDLNKNCDRCRISMDVGLADSLSPNAHTKDGNGSVPHCGALVNTHHANGDTSLYVPQWLQLRYPMLQSIHADLALVEARVPANMKSFRFRLLRDVQRLLGRSAEDSTRFSEFAEAHIQRLRWNELIVLNVMLKLTQRAKRIGTPDTELRRCAERMHCGVDEEWFTCLEYFRLRQREKGSNRQQIPQQPFPMEELRRFQTSSTVTHLSDCNAIQGIESNLNWQMTSGGTKDVARSNEEGPPTTSSLSSSRNQALSVASIADAHHPNCPQRSTTTVALQSAVFQKEALSKGGQRICTSPAPRYREDDTVGQQYRVCAEADSLLKIQTSGFDATASLVHNQSGLQERIRQQHTDPVCISGEVPIVHLPTVANAMASSSGLDETEAQSFSRPSTQRSLLNSMECMTEGTTSAYPPLNSVLSVDSYRAMTYASFDRAMQALRMQALPVFTPSLSSAIGVGTPLFSVFVDEKSQAVSTDSGTAQASEEDNAQFGGTQSARQRRVRFALPSSDTGEDKQHAPPRSPRGCKESNGGIGDFGPVASGSDSGTTVVKPTSSAGDLGRLDPKLQCDKAERITRVTSSETEKLRAKMSPFNSRDDLSNVHVPAASFAPVRRTSTAANLSCDDAHSPTRNPRKTTPHMKACEQQHSHCHSNSDGPGGMLQRHSDLEAEVRERIRQAKERQPFRSIRARERAERRKRSVFLFPSKTEVGAGAREAAGSHAALPLQSVSSMPLSTQSAGTWLSTELEETVKGEDDKSACTSHATTESHVQRKKEGSAAPQVQITDKFAPVTHEKLENLSQYHPYLCSLSGLYSPSSHTIADQQFNSSPTLPSPQRTPTLYRRADTTAFHSSSESAQSLTALSGLPFPPSSSPVSVGEEDGNTSQSRSTCLTQSSPSRREGGGEHSPTQAVNTPSSHSVALGDHFAADFYQQASATFQLLQRTRSLSMPSLSSAISSAVPRHSSQSSASPSATSPIVIVKRGGCACGPYDQRARILLTEMENKDEEENNGDTNAASNCSVDKKMHSNRSFSLPKLTPFAATEDSLTELTASESGLLRNAPLSNSICWFTHFHKDAAEPKIRTSSTALKLPRTHTFCMEGEGNTELKAASAETTICASDECTQGCGIGVQSGACAGAIANTDMVAHRYQAYASSFDVAASFASTCWAATLAESTTETSGLFSGEINEGRSPRFSTSLLSSALPVGSAAGVSVDSPSMPLGAAMDYYRGKEEAATSSLRDHSALISVSDRNDDVKCVGSESLSHSLTGSSTRRHSSELQRITESKVHVRRKQAIDAMYNALHSPYVSKEEIAETFDAHFQNETIAFAHLLHLHSERRVAQKKREQPEETEAWLMQPQGGQKQESHTANCGMLNIGAQVGAKPACEAEEEEWEPGKRRQFFPSPEQNESHLDCLAARIDLSAVPLRSALKSTPRSSLQTPLSSVKQETPCQATSKSEVPVATLTTNSNPTTRRPAHPRQLAKEKCVSIVNNLSSSTLHGRPTPNSTPSQQLPHYHKPQPGKGVPLTEKVQRGTSVISVPATKAAVERGLLTSQRRTGNGVGWQSVRVGGMGALSTSLQRKSKETAVSSEVQQKQAQRESRR